MNCVSSAQRVPRRREWSSDRLMSQVIIKNSDIREAGEIFAQLGERSYRARQLFSWLYEKNIESFDEMTNFSKDLRKSLADNFILTPLKLEEHLISKIDGTEKFLFSTLDGNYIESVLLKNDGTEEGRVTVCISSQIGCKMGCRFCQTARIGFKRNLETGEILDQLNQIRRTTGIRNNNIVFMGMGEPFGNYENVMKAADIMNYSFGFHISARKITISTSGLTEGIERFIDEKRPYNLAISLNDTQHEKRIINMPVEKKYPFKGIVDLLKRKFPVSKNRVTIEYVMRKDNISIDDARRLQKMFKYGRIKLNLIPLNPGDHPLEVPGQDEIDAFISELEKINVPLSVRKSLGSDIDGACGQLSGRKYKTESL
jgi:23S rRNA (adenine2503-C2)-methyltransferase